VNESTGSDQGLSPALVADDFETPSDATIDAVLVRLSEPQLRRSFFSKLENPNWVTPLAEREAFPKPTVTDEAEGDRVHSLWPEGDYLVRMAGLVPNEVFSVLVGIADTQNYFAQAAVIQACGKLPPALAVKLADYVAKYLDTPKNFHNPVDLNPVDLASAMRNVLKFDDWKAVAGLVNAIYSPRKTGTDEGPPGPRARIGAGIEDYWYGKTLPEVAAVMTERHQKKGVRTLVAWLEQWQVLTERFNKETGWDFSNVWRPSIAHHSRSHGFEDLGDALVDAALDSIVHLCENTGVTNGLGPLLKNPQPLLQRIGMEAAANVAANLAEGDELTELLGIAQKWIEDPKYFHSTYRVEYSHLLDALAVTLTEPEVDRWVEMVKQYDFLPDERIIGFLKQDDPESSEVSPDQVSAYRNRRRRDILASLRSDQLPEEIVVYRDELVQKHGEANHVKFASCSVSSDWLEPTSPLSSEELAGMGLPDLIGYLSTWEPPPDGVFGPTVEGLGRQLAERVKGNPRVFAAEARAFVGLEPTYVHSLISGLDQALRDECIDIDWDAVLGVCEYVVRQPRGSEGAADFLWMRSAVASLMATAVSNQAFVTEFGNRILEVLAILTDDPQPTPEYEETHGGTNMDPLTLSLNTIRSVAVRGVVRLFLTNCDLAQPVERIHERSLELLDQHVGTDADPSLAVQAVFGEHLGRLISKAPTEWLGERIVRSLGSPTTVLSTTATPGADTVWSVMLATYHPKSWIVESMSKYLSQRIDAVGSERSEVVGWIQERNPAQLLGDWLVILFVQGAIDGPSNDDGFLSRFFHNADPELCAQVLEQLGWALGRSEGVPPEPLTRAKELWSWRALTAQSDKTRAPELSGFAVWIRTGHFPDDWWMSELLRAVDITKLRLHLGLGEALADATVAGRVPQALKIAKALLTDSSGFGSYESYESYDLMEHLPTILAYALRHDDDDVRSSASSLMDALGRKGHLALADQVAAAQARL